MTNSDRDSAAAAGATRGNPSLPPDAASLESHPPTPIRLIATVLLPLGLGYFLSYLFRSVNAVIADDLTADLGLDATGLGLLTAAFFLSFAAFQLPLGVLLDRYGPRRVQVALLSISALGSLLFGLAESTLGLTLARALIGLGASGSLMAAFKANTLWWPRERLPLVNGCFMASGALGALAATTPVAWLAGIADWRAVFFVLALASVATALILLFVSPRDDLRLQVEHGLGNQLRGLYTVMTSAAFWRMTPMVMMAQAMFFSYQGLWAGPWLRTVEGMDRAETALTLQGMPVAMLAGFLFFGFASDILARRGISTVRVMVMANILFIMTALMISSGVRIPAVMGWAAFGFFGTASVLGYAILSQAFAVHLSGRVNAGLNLLVFLAAFVMQSCVGLIIDAIVAAGPWSDPEPAHRLALAVASALCAVGTLWFLASRARLIPDSEWNKATDQ